MNNKAKLALSIAGTLLISGTAFAGKAQEAGQGGSLTYTKPTTTSVAVYPSRHGVVNADRSEMQGKVVWHTTGPFGNSGPISYYTESR
jgi:hypothetical protein